MPGNMDWRQLAQALPMILAQAKGGMQGNAFMQSYQQSQMLREQMRQRQEQLELQKRQQATVERRQEQMAEAEKREQEAQMEAQRRASASQAQQAMSKLLETATTNAEDVTGAENMTLAGANAVESLYGVAPGTLNPYVQSVKPMMSQRVLSDYQNRLKDLHTQWKDQGGFQSLWDSDATITMGGGRAPVKFREMVNAVGGVAMKDGKPVFPNAQAAASTGSMEQQDLAAYAASIGKPVADLSYQDRMAFRRSRALSDDKPADPALASINQQLAETRLDTAQRDAAEKDRTRQAASRADESKRQALVEFDNSILTELDNLTKKAGNQYVLNEGTAFLTGGSAPLGGVAAVVKSGGASANARVSLTRLQNLLNLETIQAMKAQSRTGATGFGQLSERELAVLESAAARLSTWQSEGQLLAALKDIREKIEKSLREAQGGAVNAPTAPNISSNPFRVGGGR